MYKIENLERNSVLSLEVWLMDLQKASFNCEESHKRCFAVEEWEEGFTE